MSSFVRQHCTVRSPAYNASGLGFPTLTSPNQVHDQISKNACSDPQPHLPNFFKHVEILEPDVESYLQGFL